MTPASGLYLLEKDVAWWPDLARFAASGDDDARRRLFRALVEGGHANLPAALASALLFGPSEAWGSAGIASGVSSALQFDLDVLMTALRAAAARDAEEVAERPRLEQLAPMASGPVAELAQLIANDADAASVHAWVRAWREAHGGGPEARYVAFRWSAGGLEGISHPARPDLGHLVGLASQIDVLERNTRSFLDGGPAMNALLYGPRGSGKSTVVRGLLVRHAQRGLRLVEVPAAALERLPSILESVARRPERFILFVDDLAFEAGDARYQPFKSLLEGSVAERPDNVRVYATSNRRHLLQERLRDRPDPLDDDVHAWDTHHERLALSDRFGLVVTFPSAGQAAYVAMVRELLERQAPDLEVDDLAGRADRFARAGNGYSGRTAQQFVDALRAGLV